jgi:lipopolysaccharide transport system ATP-binding protein
MIGIEISNVSKIYRIRSGNRSKYLTLSGQISDGVKKLANVFKRERSSKNKGKVDHYALKNVTLAVECGDKLGIIGRNGAGKSTLLKVLSRITPPSKGRVVIYGSVSSLLEVGTGFHPELTGYENIYLNGAIIGMPKKEIDRKIDEIIAFSEIDKYINTPVKRYSSGMYVRLAFAVAAHLESDIMFVDEVLAVGDRAFQEKCLNKMNEVSTTGRTVIFVSHNMAAVRGLCNKGLYLDNGEIAHYGEIDETIREYISDIDGGEGSYVLCDEDELNRIQANEVLLANSRGDVTNRFTIGDKFRVHVQLKCTSRVDDVVVGLGIISALGVPIMTSWSKATMLMVGDHKYTFTMNDIMLSAGVYNVVIGASSRGASLFYSEGKVQFYIEDYNRDKLSESVLSVQETGVVLNQMIIEHNRE